jgi:hypothetical protein
LAEERHIPLGSSADQGRPPLWLEVLMVKM